MRFLIEEALLGVKGIVAQGIDAGDYILHIAFNYKWAVLTSVVISVILNA